MNDKNNNFLDLSAASPTAEEILSYLTKSGIVDLDGVKESMKKSRKKVIFEKYEKQIKKLNGKTDKRYYIRVKDPAKKDGRRTFKAPTKEELLEKVYTWHMYGCPGESISFDIEKITLADLFEKFYEYKKKTTWSRSSCTRNMSVWKNYYLGSEIIKKPIREIKLKDLEEWAYGLIKGRRLTKKEFDNVATWMKQMMEYAEREEIIDKNYYRLLKIKNLNVFREPKSRSDENMVLTLEDELLLYEECLKLYKENHFPVNRMIPLAIILLFQIGCRPCEVCVLRYSDIRDSEVVISRLYSEKEDQVKENHTKAGHGSRAIPVTALTAEVIAMIKEQRGVVEESDYILVQDEDELRGFYNRLRKTFPLICKRVGIPYNTAYSGRRTFISSLIDQNISVRTIQNYVGHKEAKTTFNNYYYDRSEKKKRVEELENARLVGSIRDIVPTVPS